MREDGGTDDVGKEAGDDVAGCCCKGAIPIGPILGGGSSVS